MAIVGLNKDDKLETAQVRDGAVLTLSHEVSIAQGDVPGHFQMNAFGDLVASGSTVYDVWRGPTAIKPGPVYGGYRGSVVSTNAADSAAGAGVRRVRIQYLNTAGALLTEDVTLNGTTPVLTVATNIMFVECMHSIENGTYGGVAIGDITIRNGATVMNLLAAGGNRCTSAHRMVPLGKTLYITGWAGSSAASTSSKRTVIKLRTTALEEDTLFAGTFLFRSTMVCLDSALYVPFTVPLRVPSLAEIKITANTAGASDVTGEFFGWCEG